MEKIDIREYDWMTEEGEIVIRDGIALRDIDENENLISYGRIL